MSHLKSQKIVKIFEILHVEIKGQLLDKFSELWSRNFGKYDVVHLDEKYENVGPFLAVKIVSWHRDIVGTPSIEYNC